MTARDHPPATAERPRNNASFFQGVLDHPILVTVSALLLIGALLFCNTLLTTSGPIKAVVHVERLDLDPEADSPISLIRTLPLSIDDERPIILSDQLIDDAIESAVTTPNSIESSDNVNAPHLDRRAFSAALRTGLTIDATTVSNELAISLRPSVLKSRDRAIDVVNAIAANYVELRNREREQQKQQALQWADRQFNDRDAGAGGQGKKPVDREEAGDQRVELENNLDRLISSGRLDEPAANIVQPATTAKTSRQTLSWSAAIPLAAISGIALAVILVGAITTSMSALNGQQDNTVSSGGVLVDPYWPLKSRQRQKDVDQHRQS